MKAHNAAALIKRVYANQEHATIAGVGRDFQEAILLLESDVDATRFAITKFGYVDGSVLQVIMQNPTWTKGIDGYRVWARVYSCR